MIVVFAGIALIPLHVHVGPFSNPKESAAFLTIAWQVEAAALGLTVAVIIFAFSAFYSRGQPAYGLSLADFASQTGVLVVVRLGISGLLIGGMVLLGAGGLAPAGWPGVWATALAAITFGALPFLFDRTLVAIDPGSLRASRIQRLKLGVREIVDREVFEHLALNELNSWCEAHEVKYNPRASPCGHHRGG